VPAPLPTCSRWFRIFWLSCFMCMPALMRCSFNRLQQQQAGGHTRRATPSEALRTKRQHDHNDKHGDKPHHMKSVAE
jgi:ABC-type nickel/cobalt efflux system permease component RcnA